MHEWEKLPDFCPSRDAKWYAAAEPTNSPPPFRRRNLFIDSSVGQRVWLYALEEMIDLQG